jgi:hypothetical protein
MRHDKQYFYKYVSAKTALSILQNKLIKYSSPLTFNDPFDVQTKIDYEFELNDFISLLSAEFDHGINALIDKFKDEHKKINDWWRLEVKDSRVFCVAEDNDNLLMWAHYAEDHHGAVIKFECLPVIGNTLCAAMKVNYVNKPPVIATLDEYIKSLIGEHKLDFDLLYFKLFTSKSDHWKYEKEWRVFIPSVEKPHPALANIINKNDSMSILMDVYPQEIHSIYLGCKMEGNIQKDIENSLTGDFSHVQIYKSTKDEREYKLTFKQIR